MKNKIVTCSVLKCIVQDLKQKGKVIVSTSGCFDLLHAGHVTYLEQAAKKGDIFILFLNSDISVRALKGPSRPLTPQDERAIVVAGLECVDYVCLFDESTPCSIIEQIQPDIFVKGGDYFGKRIPEMDSVNFYGGKVEYVCLIEGCSTTGTISKIKKLVKENLL